MSRSGALSAGSGGELGQPQVFVQDTEPSASYPYIWVVTDGAGNPTGEIHSHYGGAIGPVDVDAIQGLVDAKGELLAGSAADTLTRVAAGTNGQVLTANSGVAAGVEWAAAALEAVSPIPGLLAPNASPEVGGYSAPTANILRGCRVIAPSAATRLREVYLPVSNTNTTGNARGAVYDIGATTSAVRTKIFDGASTPVVNAVNGWLSLGDANLAITGGQHLDLAAMFDNASASWGRRSIAGGAEAALPSTIAQIGGCLYKIGWTNSPGAFTTPATLAEVGTSVVITSYPVLIARWT